MTATIRWNASVPSAYAGDLNIQGKVSNDNWFGVVVYQNANRSSADGSDPGAQTPPSGTSVDTWINTAPTRCAANLSETSPIDYNSLCQWRSQNVTVQDNTFEFNPSDSIYGGQCTDISNNQNNYFQNNTNTGPRTFMYFNQGDMEGPAAWQAGRLKWKAPVITSEPKTKGAPAPRRQRVPAVESSAT